MIMSAKYITENKKVSLTLSRGGWQTTRVTRSLQFLTRLITWSRGADLKGKSERGTQSEFKLRFTSIQGGAKKPRSV